jgi:hypothetical protein
MVRPWLALIWHMDVPCTGGWARYGKVILHVAESPLVLPQDCHHADFTACLPSSSNSIRLHVCVKDG